MDGASDPADGWGADDADRRPRRVDGPDDVHRPGRNGLPWEVVRVGYILGVATPLLALGYAIWQLWNEWVGWREVTLLVGFYLLNGLGLTIGYHRLLSHRSFETGPAVKAVLLVLGAMALPARPLDFAAYHLQHHAHADGGGRPAQPPGRLAPRTCRLDDGRRAPDRVRYCRHLRGDRVVDFVERTSLLWFGFGLLLPTAIDGWRGFVWGGLSSDGHPEPRDVRGQLDLPRLGTPTLRNAGREPQQPARRRCGSLGEGWPQQSPRVPVGRLPRDRLAAAGPQRPRDPGPQADRPRLERTEHAARGDGPPFWRELRRRPVPAYQLRIRDPIQVWHTIGRERSGAYCFSIRSYMWS